MLALSNLLLGGLSVYLLRTLDADYSRLIDDSLPVLNEIRFVGKEAGDVFRAVIAGLVTPDPGKCAAAITRAKEAMRRERQMRLRVQAAEIFSDQPGLVNELGASGEAYEAAVNALLPRVTPENTADAEKDSIEKLQLVVDRFASAVQKASEYIETHTEAVSGDYTAAVRHRSIVVLGLAGWPLLAAVCFLAVTLAVVVGMLVVFRSADIGDGP